MNIRGGGEFLDYDSSWAIGEWFSCYSNQVTLEDGEIVRGEEELFGMPNPHAMTCEGMMSLSIEPIVSDDGEISTAFYSGSYFWMEPCAGHALSYDDCPINDEGPVGLVPMRSIAEAAVADVEQDLISFSRYGYRYFIRPTFERPQSVPLTQPFASLLCH